MDGDSPNLVELFAVADRHEAMVVIDEAHATGVLGPQGRGLAAAFEGRRNVITLHTCGKALGTVGGFVLAPRVVRDFLVNRSRPFIFATAPSRLSWAPTRVRCAAARPMHSRCPARNPTALCTLPGGVPDGSRDHLHDGWPAHRRPSAGALRKRISDPGAVRRGRAAASPTGGYLGGLANALIFGWLAENAAAKRTELTRVGGST
jgi:hypothetical protein